MTFQIVDAVYILLTLIMYEKKILFGFTIKTTIMTGSIVNVNVGISIHPSF